jgi:hypothetical protein
VLAGCLFTASFFIWLANIVINRVYQGQTFLGFAFEPRIRLVIGAALVTLLIGAVFTLAGWRQRRFEGFAPPRAVRRRAMKGDEPDGDSDGSPAAATGPEVTARDASLADPRFWYRPAYARAMLFVHVLVGLAAVALVTAWAWWHSQAVDPSRPEPGHLHLLRIAGLATYATEAALWAIVALTIVHAVGWGRRPKGAVRFHWLGPTTAATTGVAFGTMFAYALPLLFGANSAGRVAVLATSFGIATLALLGAGVGLFVWFLARKRAELRRARSDQPPYAVPAEPGGRDGAELEGATDAIYGAIAGSRALSEAGRTGTIALSLSALAFLVSALYQFRFGEVRWLAWSVRLGEIVAIGGIGATLIFLIRNARKPNERRIVGMIWDVLTFWPRRYHPFGVRPYAERAVPEIEARLVDLVRAEGRRVVLSCHSQGTVLGYAALVQVPDDVAGEIAFVTYGAPLRQLYEMAFPAFFSPAGFVALRGRLFDDGRTPAASWRGFYRLTDYIGKTVFEDPAFEEMVPDPAMGPPTTGAPLDRPFGDAFPDTPRDTWTELLLHSYYNREAQLKAWLHEVKCRMGEPHVGCDD